MYYEEQASFIIQCMSEVVGSIPIEKWDEFLTSNGGWPEDNKTSGHRCAMRKLTFKFLKSNLGFGVDVIPVNEEEKKRFWVNAKIEDFIAEEMESLEDKELALDMKSALRKAFHKTAQHYMIRVSYQACKRNVGEGV